MILVVEVQQGGTYANDLAYSSFMRIGFGVTGYQVES